jgi:hypothetical protein
MGKIKHNFTGSKLYRKWADMLQRCKNPKSTNYKYYGGKGIRVQEEWNDFIPFMEWALENGYEEDLSIDRIDPLGNYEPENCRWVTREVQDNNKSDNVRVNVRGEEMTLMQLSRRYKLSYGMISHRYNVGDRGEKLIEPARRGIKRNGEKPIRKLTKLTKLGIAEIKWLLNNTELSQKVIGERYGVTQIMVSRIKTGKAHCGIEPKKPGDKVG